MPRPVAFSRTSRQKVHPNCAQNLGRQIPFLASDVKCFPVPGLVPEQMVAPVHVPPSVVGKMALMVPVCDFGWFVHKLNAR